MLLAIVRQLRQVLLQVGVVGGIEVPRGGHRIQCAWIALSSTPSGLSFCSGPVQKIQAKACLGGSDSPFVALLNW